MSKEGHAAKKFQIIPKLYFQRPFRAGFLPGSISAKGAHDIQCLAIELFILIQFGSDAQQFFYVVVPGVKAGDWICCTDGNRECSFPILKDIMEWINAGSALQWTGEKLIMNIAVISTCQTPISFSNGLERGSTSSA